MSSVFLVLTPHLEYDDNYYYSSGGDSVAAVYSTEEEAQAHTKFANEKALSEAFEGWWSYQEEVRRWFPGSWPSDDEEDRSTLARIQEILDRGGDRDILDKISKEEMEFLHKHLEGPYYYTQVKVREKFTPAE